MFKKKSSKEKNGEDEVPPSPKSPQPTPSYGGQPDVGGESKEQRIITTTRTARIW